MWRNKLASLKYKAGGIYPTRCGVDVEVLFREHRGDSLIVKFLDVHGYECSVSASDLGRGLVRNPYTRTVMGIGYMGVGDYTYGVDGVPTRIHRVWSRTFTRSYSDAYQDRFPTYTQCTVDSAWHCFQDFARWTETAVGWGNSDWELDKDLICRGNKVYGPDYCVMLPKKLNMLLIARGKSRGEHPIGVCKDAANEGWFMGSCKDITGKRLVKRFKTEDEAFIFYKNIKERIMKEHAEIYRDQIDPRAYEALVNWEILITD